MFVGTHTPRLDDKGRLILPARFRDQLGEGIVMTQGQEHCVYIWPLAAFAEMAAGSRAQSFADRRARDFSRSFFANAFDETPDKQGRITVPPRLRRYAHLERDCVVIGVWNRLELWDATRWEDYSAGADEDFAQMSDEEVPGFS